MTQYKGAIVIPTSHEDSDHVIEQVEHSLAHKFGGYSTYEGTGGWESDGEMVEESHVRVEAIGSVEDEFTGQFFTKLGRFVRDQLNESAVMVEIQETDMRLV